MKKNAFVFSESARLLCELIHGGTLLADSVTAACIDGNGTHYASLGAQTVYSFEKNDSAPIEAYADALAALIESSGADLILIGATVRGKSLAALLAEALGAGASTDCQNIRYEADTLCIDRQVFGGAGVRTESCSGRYILTVPAMTFEPATADRAQIGSVTNLSPDLTYPAKIVGTEAFTSSDVDITAANTVVAVGRGLNHQEDLAMIDALAETLGGVVGCSRPIAADNHWLSHDRYIGLSGKSVSPKLYVAAGISGQIQHIASAQGAKVIVAINKDANAPVFKAADYGIVGDMYQVIPALTKKLREIKK